MDLHVFPTSRSIRAFYKDALTLNQLLPHAITIGEFEQKSLLYQDKTYIDANIRPFLLHGCTQFDAFDKLHFSTELFSFLDNSTYILRLFDELSLENISFESLSDADTYVEYQEHLSILEQVYTCYQEKLSSLDLIDKVNMTQKYTLNKSFLQAYDTIYIHLEGILSQFELRLFEHISKIVSVQVYFNHVPYSEKMKDMFEGIGFSITSYGKYRLDLKNKSILQVDDDKRAISIKQTAVPNRMLQLGFIAQSIFDMTETGMKPEEIVVLVPDESFTKIMREFDAFRNFNYAMGKSFDESTLYRDLSYVKDYLHEKNEITIKKIQRVGLDDIITHAWGNDILALLEAFDKRPYSKDEKKTLQKTLYRFNEVLVYADTFSLQDKLSLLLKMLKKVSIDDVGGGKITVMGVLESRGISYKGVIAVDFNEGIVPKLNVKDMFLSSTVRKHAGLPSVGDRINLQKYYYTQLFSKAKEVRVSYVKNDELQRSRFLEELPSYELQMGEKYLHEILFNASSFVSATHKEIKMEYDFTKEILSASKLNTYFSCKRKYYYQYIRSLDTSSGFKTLLDARDIGIILHDALSKIDESMDKSKMLDVLGNTLAKHKHEEIDAYELDMWMKRLEHFVTLEQIRFERGVKVAYKEKKFSCVIEGFDFEGRIDRIDMQEDKYHIIDYKSGKIKPIPKDLEKVTDFQMIIYMYLTESLGDVEDAYYYELSSGKMIGLERYEQMKEMFIEKLQMLKNPIQNFSLCEDTKACNYCAYKILCEREDV